MVSSARSRKPLLGAVWTSSQSWSEDLRSVPDLKSVPSGKGGNYNMV